MSQPLVDSTLPAHSPTLRCSSAPFSPLSSPGKRSQAPVVPSPERFASAPKQLRSNLTKSVNAATNGAARLAPYSMDHHDAVLKAKLGSSSEVPHLAPQLPVKAMSAHVSSAQPERPVPTLALDHVASSGTTARTTAKVNATSDRPQQHRPPAPANQQPTPPGLAANYNVPIYPLSTYAHRDMLAADARGAALVSGHEHWVALVELGHLASQHHMSPYSMMKYGAQGSPYAYVPFTLQQPQLVEQTLARQREQERKAKQWQLRKRERVIKLRSCSEQARAPTQASINSPQHPEDPSAPFDPAVLDPNVGRVEAELLLAMSEPIGRDSAGRWPDNCQLGQAALQQTLPFPASSKANSLSALGLDLTPAPTTSDNGVQGPLDEQARAGSEVRIVGPLAPEVMLTQEMEQPVAPSGLPAPAMSSGSDAPQSHHVPIADMPPQQQQALAMKTSDTHPINISPIIPQELLGVISERIYNKLPARLLGEGQLGKSDVPTLSLNSPTRHRQRQAMGVQLISLEPDVDLADATGPGGSKYMERLGIRPGAGPSAQTAQPTPLPASPMIGNLLLSSCPGKKVRLTGPVRGRGAICRDLGLDLRRICQIGVGAVVCCLDDEELRFLGAPWEEYEREADELGLDVIRLPMAEGFAPSCTATIDAAITSVVTDYTLRGLSVLVHCRGGVGRAGLIACTWMLKMGLVGPPVDGAISISSGAHPPSGLPVADDSDAEGQKLLHTVERLIETIRRRRSPKAIETAEQVKFIVDYVAYLRHQHHLAIQNQLASTPAEEQITTGGALPLFRHT